MCGLEGRKVRQMMDTTEAFGTNCHELEWMIR